jgi:Na+-transporting NADH:ubiquinone oxidoreductase subunit NqrA
VGGGMSITVNVDVDIDLSDIETEDLVEELEMRNHTMPINLGGVDIDRIRHLMLCGLVEQAKAEAWQMIEKTLRATA